jgi:probable F420-dependent oxidoreductase
MRWAAFLPGRGPDEWLAWARRYEDAGFASLWQGEIVNSALVPLAAVAPATRRIALGTGVSLAFTHSPVMLALAALDMDVASGGRFVLGLGVAHQGRNNRWYAGRDAGKPVAQMREYLSVVRQVMEVAPRGGNLQYEGAYYTLRARNFFGRGGVQPRPRVPVYLAAVFPRMAALACELADGIIGNPMYSPRHVRDVILPAVTRGLERAGRRRTDVELLGQCFTVIDDDLATARRVAAGALLFSVWARIYDPIFAAHGFQAVVDEVRALQAAGDPGPALDRIPPEMVDAFCAVGPVDRVRRALAERDGLLDTVILAVPSTLSPPDEQARYRERILEVFGA